MRETAEIVRRLEISAADLEQLRRDCVAGGIGPLDALDIEEAAAILVHLAGRLNREPRRSVNSGDRDPAETSRCLKPAA